MKSDFTRREFIKSTTLTALAGLALGHKSFLQAALPEKPNIILIITDQERSMQHFPEGWEEQNLPNLTRLKAKGMSFTNAFCNTSMCSPSRATLFTGLYPAQHGVTDTLPEAVGKDGEDQVQALQPDMQNMAKMLKSAGYQVYYKGKWHLSRPSGSEWVSEDLVPFGFDGWDPPDGGEDVSPENFGGGRAAHDQRYTNDAVEFLNTVDTGQPFALIVSLINPHDVAGYPDTYTEDYADSYLQGTIDLPPTLDEDLSNNYKPKAHAELLNRLAVGMGVLITDKRRHEYLNFYGNLMKDVDAQIGAVLDALYARNDGQTSLADNTLVIRTADHGEMGLAHGGLRQKMFVTYEEAMHLPLVISNPVLFPAPQTCDGLVSLIDIMPTLATLAGVSNRDNWTFHGVDFSSLLSNPTASVQDEIMFTFDDIKAGQENIEQMVTPPNRIRCLREKNWKYARYFDQAGVETPEYEMYDLVNDPLEMQNLAHPLHPRYNEPAVVEERNRLAAKLAQMEAEKLAPLQTGISKRTTAKMDFHLYPNYPNPFNGTTTIEYVLQKDMYISLDIFDITGKRTTTLYKGHQIGGAHSAHWDGLNSNGMPVASGVYECVLTAGQQRIVRQLNYIK